MALLGGTVRRCVAVLTAVSVLLGVIGFAVDKHVGWAWLAIGGLVVLVVGATWTAWAESKRVAAAERASTTPAHDPGLERLISEGHGLVARGASVERDAEWAAWRAHASAWIRGRYDDFLVAAKFSRQGNMEPDRTPFMGPPVVRVGGCWSVAG